MYDSIPLNPANKISSEHLELASKVASDICERFSPEQQRDFINEVSNCLKNIWQGRVGSAKENYEIVSKHYEVVFGSK